MPDFSYHDYDPEDPDNNLPEEKSSLQNAIAIALMVIIILILAATSNSITTWGLGY